ncbi:hypothetical protein SORBI_3005G092500 [Sorghum bicolor]|uniref:Squalene cyclase N-terminal domain-containing protein n=1 Tax=Sorghum bicolor TaxID=4558 RepID=A0A1Z5RIF4_SORBI|nr:hypothetical protein SORBI_3005G092500 [Sorghum bicolor]OQU83215.1 hypothetical protein SORBI_3005G092500 [Sorghum bicolor]
MWRLKVSERSSPWLGSVNNLLGRQEWVLDPDDLGTPEERAQVDRARREFADHRFERKHSSDLLMRIQYAKENPHNHLGDLPPAVKLQENDDDIITEEAVWTSVKRAVNRVCNLQAHDGHWPADYGGLLFLMPGLIITLYVSGVLNAVLSSEHQIEILRYIYNHQNEDGGWGLHIEGHSTMLSSALNYVALRLLGECPNGGDGAMEKGRNWILDHGGAIFMAAWGKFWLSVLGVYDWSGNNPVPPELWLLPHYLPFHPGRVVCYCRMVYMPMSYIYGRRFVGPITPLVLELRKELYTDAYDEIDWNKARTECAKVLNMLARWIEDPNSEAFKCHIARVYDFLWIAEDGMKMQIYDGSQLWDATFTVEVLLATGLVKELGPTLKRAHSFIKNSQLLENCLGDLNYWHRHISKGGWTFSTADDGWQVSDCSANGLKVCLLLSTISPEIVGEPLEIERQFDAVNCLMSLMNNDGGFSAFEPTRSSPWLEEIIGVFMQTAMASYSQYRNIFPIWALTEYRRRVLLAGKKSE